MALPLSVLRKIQGNSYEKAWQEILRRAWEVLCAPIKRQNEASQVTSRDREIGSLDLYLAMAAWDLWEKYEESVSRTSDLLVSWWEEQSGGKAILILDGLSLREASWVVEGAKERGYVVHRAMPSGSELPADTTPFAKALGFSQRSALENDRAGSAHRLGGAHTDSVGVAFEDCVDLVGSHQDFP